MGFFSSIFGGADGCRKAVRESYYSHVQDIRRGKLKVANVAEAHYFGLYGALETRYWLRGIKVNEPQMYSELAPFCAMKNEIEAIESLAEYVIYKERPNDARTEWLKKNINSALQSCKKDDPFLSMAAAGVQLYQFPWCALLDAETRIVIGQADLGR